MEIWQERVLWREYVHPHTQSKKSEILHTHTQSCGDSSSKRGRIQTILTGASLFAISNNNIRVFGGQISQLKLLTFWNRFLINRPQKHFRLREQRHPFI